MQLTFDARFLDLVPHLAFPLKPRENAQFETAGLIRLCCRDQTADEIIRMRGISHAMRSNLGRPSSVIRLRTRTPIRASVFWFSKSRAFSFGPMTAFHLPICVSPRLR